MQAYRLKALGLVGSAVLAFGCARPVPQPFLSARASVPGYEWPPRTLAQQAAGETATSEPDGSPSSRQAKLAQEPAKSAPFEAPSAAYLSPSDEQCLDELRQRGVRFTRLAALRGVETPIEVNGSLGGVSYWVSGHGPIRMDCRFALALAQVGPVLQHHGVQRVRFSGAYVYKTAPSGRLSHHAYGVAIDLHDFETTTGLLSVKGDFRRGAGCGRRVPLMNRIACDLKNQGLFDEFLTPDYNRAHRDHLHVSISRPGR